MRFRLMIVLLLAVGMSGCAQGEDTTPQMAAEAYRDAMAAGDWETAFAHLTPKAQIGLLRIAIRTAFGGSRSSPELTESYSVLAEELRLDRPEAELLQADNLGELYSRVVAWVESNLPAGQGGTAFQKISEGVGKVTFTNFQIEGTNATATMTSGANSQQIKFRKLNGRWLMET